MASRARAVASVAVGSRAQAPNSPRFPVWSYSIGVQNRRQFLAIAGAGLGLVPLVGWLGRSEVVETSAMGDSRFPVQATEAEWRAALTPEQFRVLRSHGTERPFTSALNTEKRRGTFVCAACGQPLFSLGREIR